MKIGKKILKCALASALLLVTLGFISCESTTEMIFNGKDYTEERISREEDYLITEIVYPKFINFPELNKIIKNTVVSNLNNFSDYAEENWNRISGLNQSSYYPPFNYTVDYKVTYSGDVISVYLSTYNFAGGAHGNTSIKTINYDKKSKKDISITEATSYTYEELSDLCNKSLYKQYVSDDKSNMTQETVEILDQMRDAGTAPYAGNFQNYVLDGGKLIIYFEPYTVAPYSYGIPQVELPKK